MRRVKVGVRAVNLRVCSLEWEGSRRAARSAVSYTIHMWWVCRSACVSKQCASARNLTSFKLQSIAIHSPIHASRWLSCALFSCAFRLVFFGTYQLLLTFCDLYIFIFLFRVFFLSSSSLSSFSPLLIYRCRILSSRLINFSSLHSYFVIRCHTICNTNYNLRQV